MCYPRPDMTGLRGRIALFAIALALFIGSSSYSQDNSIDTYVTVYAEQDSHGNFDFYADSSHMIDCYLYVTFSRLDGLVPDVRLPYTRMIPAGARHLPLFRLNASSSTSRGYAITYSIARGNPDDVHPDPGYLYALPFDHGTKHRVTQGYNGRFTHRGENEYALDFDMPPGTPVCAARGGVVVEVKDDSNVGGPSVQYSKYGNYILIEHSDGTFGNYVHLRQGGALVHPGDRVQTGQIIGYSGATGEASGPHLHFDVRVPTHDGRMQTIPVQFLGANGRAVHPEEGRFYYSYHPGLPPFKVVLGANLSNADYVDYRASTDLTNRVDLRIDTVDLTYVVFARNGYATPVRAEISMFLRGMSSTTPLPATIELPPETELFFTLLRPQQGVSQYGYSYRIRVSPVDEADRSDGPNSQSRMVPDGGRSAARVEGAATR